MSQKVEYSLLEPLMGSDGEAQEEVTFEPASRKESKAHRVEQCGKVKLFVLCTFGFLVIYVSLATSRVTQQVIPVNLPPDDNDDPSPLLNRDPVLADSEHTSTSIASDKIPRATTETNNNETMTVPKGFLVWSPQCKIVSLNPLASDAMQFYAREKPTTCSSKPPLTRVEWRAQNQSYFVTVVDAARKSYQGADHCSYQEVTRLTEEKMTYSTAIKFTTDIKIGPNVETVHVECFREGRAKSVYKDVHFVVQRKEAVLERLKKLEPSLPARDEKRPLSVLLFGIDSISRLNLLRSMPTTAQHLYDNGWFEMRGYNKMGDNTYPNLMAILTGYNISLAYNKCQPTLNEALDKCPFVWKDYASAGYVTGYAEDEPKIGTFNYRKKGFSVAPTDYYGRTGMQAAGMLPLVSHSGLSICLGGRTAADYVYSYGLDIAEEYQAEGTFGLYWTNSFSHNDLNGPSAMDAKIKGYLEDLGRRGILNDTIVVFFSDHGIRFGPIRKLVTGWMEERLPFLFFWLPESFREQHPDIVENLRINQNRLTNPYDLHLTLKHILQLSGRASPETDLESISPDMGCPNCMSMFKEVPWNRSCEEIGIEAHWCTCSPFMPISKNSRVVRKAVQFLIGYINKDIHQRLNGTTKSDGGRLCADLHLKTIYFAGETEYKGDTNEILIQFETTPGNGDFESTLRYSKSRDEFTVTGSISRLNVYAKHSDCVSDGRLKMYCECL